MPEDAEPEQRVPISDGAPASLPEVNPFGECPEIDPDEPEPEPGPTDRGPPPDYGPNGMAGPGSRIERMAGPG